MKGIQCPVVGAQSGNIGPQTLGCSITGPSCYDPYRQYRYRPLLQLISTNRAEPIPTHTVVAGSRSAPVATDSGHNSSSQTHSGLPQCNSRPVILAEPAHQNRVESPP